MIGLVDVNWACERDFHGVPSVGPLPSSVFPGIYPLFSLILLNQVSLLDLLKGYSLSINRPLT